MKNDKKTFIFIETVLGVMVLIVALLMLWEETDKDLEKVSVIIQNSDDNQWSAFKYGLKMAAENEKIEMFVVSTEGVLTVEEEKRLIENEIENGADAVIVQPVPGKGTAEMLTKMNKKVPVMLVESGAAKGSDKSILPKVQPDNYEMGIVLAGELLEDYSGNLKGKTLGILSETEDSQAAVSRKKGFQDGIEDAGAEVLWSASCSFTEGEADSLKSQPKVDLVIALDDNSLTRAGEYAAANNLHGAVVYGIGNSTEAFYYLDTGSAECLVVPDQFNIGYQSLTEVSEGLRNYFYKAKNRTVSHTVVRKENMFSKENQEILFTMSQ